MIKIFGILILISIEACFIGSIIIYYQYKLNLKDEEIKQRDKLLGDRTSTIKLKNIEIKELRNESKRKINK